MKLESPLSQQTVNETYDTVRLVALFSSGPAYPTLAPGSEIPEVFLTYYMTHSEEGRDCILSFFQHRALSGEERCADINRHVSYIFSIKRMDISDANVIVKVEVR
jgi:hypothetical protein